MKKELKQTLIASKVALCLLWPATAWAAQIAFGAQMAQIPMLSILMTVILSTLMGGTALLHEMKQKYAKSMAIERLGFTIAYHMATSNAAGLLMFFGAESLDIPTGRLAGAIMLAAFGGNKALASAYQFFQNKYAPEPAK